MTFSLNNFSHGGNLFRHVSLTLKKGACCHVVGLNGSGKTTFLKKIATTLVEKAPSAIVPKAWESLNPCFHFIAHTPPFHPALTVEETLRLTPKNKRSQDHDVALTLWGLLPKKNAFLYTLSQGEKQRLHLLCLTLNPLPLWLLDEPFEGLDAPFKKKLEEEIIKHLKGGGMLFIANHGPLPFSVHHTLQLPYGGPL